MTNVSKWGHVTSIQNVTNGCHPPDSCSNETCVAPLTCRASWTQNPCGCEPGFHLAGGFCQDIDECVYRPCLNGGTCHNRIPGYQCMCSKLHAGEHCQWRHLNQDPYSFTPSMAIAVLTLSLVVVVVVGVLLTIWIHRSRASGTGSLRSAGAELVTDVGSFSGAIESQLSPGKTEGLKNKEELVLLEAIQIGLAAKTSSPEKIQETRQPALLLARSNLVCGTFPGKHSHITSSVESVRDKTGTGATTAPAVRRKSLDTARNILIGSLTKKTKPSILSAGKNTSPGVFSIYATTPDVAQDDLRAYAYEGEGSPTGSLTSTFQGLRSESLESENARPLLPEYDEIFDLLKELRDAITPNDLKGDISRQDDSH
ncbi:hypothetical protein SK128_017659, partial [Halocaridina rubra]